MINQYFEKDDMITMAKYEKQKTNNVNRIAEKLEAIELKRQKEREEDLA